MSRRKRPPLSPRECETIILRREAGATYAAIAAEIGCSIGTVSWFCLKESVDPPRPRPLLKVPDRPAILRRGDHTVRKFTAEEDARLLALEAGGLGYGEIARLLGRKHNSVIGRLRTLARHHERSAP